MAEKRKQKQEPAEKQAPAESTPKSTERFYFKKEFFDKKGEPTRKMDGAATIRVSTFKHCLEDVLKGIESPRLLATYKRGAIIEGKSAAGVVSCQIEYTFK